MILFLNPRAGGGTAERRWAGIRPAVERQAGRLHVVCPGERRQLDEAVSYAFHDGERRFIASGGDGTVNALLSSLMRFRGHPGFTRLVLGAVGLGSSNDFHKHTPRVAHAGYPYRIDFTRTLRQDVGVIDMNTREGSIRRYFIVNASLGVTASGNATFNGPGLISMLKRVSPATAISFAAVKAIINHANIDVLVSFDGGPERMALLSNLAVLKNPHISGGIMAPVDVSAVDGRLGIWMEEGLSRISLLKLFLDLNSGRFSMKESSTIGAYGSVRVTAGEEFPVEFDGETAHTRDVQFSLLPGCMEVCQ